MRETRVAWISRCRLYAKPGVHQPIPPSDDLLSITLKPLECLCLIIYHSLDPSGTPTHIIFQSRPPWYVPDNKKSQDRKGSSTALLLLLLLTLTTPVSTPPLHLHSFYLSLSHALTLSLMLSLTLSLTPLIQHPSALLSPSTKRRSTHLKKERSKNTHTPNSVVHVHFLLTSGIQYHPNTYWNIWLAICTASPNIDHFNLTSRRIHRQRIQTALSLRFTISFWTPSYNQFHI